MHTDTEKHYMNAIIVLLLKTHTYTQSTTVHKQKSTNNKKANESSGLIIIIIIMIIIIISNLIFMAQFDTNGILTVLYTVTKYIQMQYVHIWTDIKQSYSYT